MKSKQHTYEALVHAFHSTVYRYAYWLTQDKSVAEDITQETFLRAWKSLDSLADESKAKAWLITIARRENARRFERKQFDFTDIEEGAWVDEVACTDVAVEQRDVQRLLASLPLEYREPLVLQLLMGFSSEEIADQFQLNKNTVLTRLFRARQQLKSKLVAQTNEHTDKPSSANGGEL